MKKIKILIASAGIITFVGATQLRKTSMFHKNETTSGDHLIPKNKVEETKTSDNIIAENKIQVALLLDTSNSMDGLIDQAKSRLWNIVNTLTTLKYNGKSPEIEIALYEYGNDNITDENFIRQVTPLTQDLDLISEKLFSLKTNGGSEYCGAVIREASNNLNWDENDKSMKLIYIAGNESFNQGKISYKDVISKAKTKNIYINTIFCGSHEEGIRTDWQNGATLGDGRYFNIDSNKQVIYIETPYDRKISENNDKLNNTYIYYGSQGSIYKNKQVAQDKNASMKSASIAVERTVSKSKKNAYNNQHWDLVDKAEKDKNYISTLKQEDLPTELRGKSTSEIQQIVSEKTIERNKIQTEIATLSVERQKYIDKEMKSRGNNDADDLGVAMEKSILELAKKNGYNN